MHFWVFQKKYYNNMSVKVSQGFAKIFVLKCIDAVENKDIMIKSYFLSKSEDKFKY